jgi:hypothetical protein
VIRDEAIERHIERYFSLLQSQLDRSEEWPKRLMFPQPQDGAERQAFERFLLKLRDAGIMLGPVDITKTR